jgi:hypothetical protein|tara:strand:- start:605 stop:844 length:240 start_codon:yes stop_codon:yes gene_type:complete
MDLLDITEERKASPGEYIYHTPTRQIVLCGSFNRKNDQIRALSRGKLFADKIKNFKKIKLNKKEKRDRIRSRRCGSCGK